MNICMITKDYRNQRLNECMKLFNFKSALNVPTRITATTATSIDNILVNLESNDYESSIINTSLTDHSCTAIDIILPNKKSNYYIYKRNLSNANHQIFKQLLTELNWETILPSTCINTSYTNFINQLSHTFNLAFPLIKISHKKKKKNVNYPPHIINRKNFISYLHCRLKTETDEKLRTGIKAILTENTKLYKQEILEFKKEENNKQITNADNKSKETWKILKKEYQEENLHTETLKIKQNEQYVFDTK